MGDTVEVLYLTDSTVTVKTTMISSTTMKFSYSQPSKRDTDDQGDVKVRCQGGK